MFKEARTADTLLIYSPSPPPHSMQRIYYSKSIRHNTSRDGHASPSGNFDHDQKNRVRVKSSFLKTTEWTRHSYIQIRINLNSLKKQKRMDNT